MSEPDGCAARDGRSGLWYLADPGDRRVRVADASGASMPLVREGTPVPWPPPRGDLEPVAEGVFSHLTGILRPRPPLPGRLARDVLGRRWRGGGLRVDAVEVRTWLAEAAPELVHDELPGLGGAAEPPVPPDRLDQVLAQRARGPGRGVTVARGIYANHPWHALWLPGTGELLSVLHTDPSSTAWPVARLASNIPVADALHLNGDPPTSLGELLERLHRLSSTGGPADDDQPASRGDPR